MIQEFPQFLDHYFPQDQKEVSTNMHQDLSVQEQELVGIIQEKELCGLSDIIINTPLPTQETIGLLTLLEMKQCIYQDSPGIYRVKE